MSDLVVFGKSREEMIAGQTEMVGWVQSQIQEANIALDEAIQNVDIAARSGWGLDKWNAAERKVRKKVEYYAKILAALQSGYVIIPDFPIDVFAIRTKRSFPVAQYTTTRDQWDMSDRTNRGQALAIGEGQYVDSQPQTQTYALERNQETQSITKWRHYSSEFNDIDFPMKAVKPIILEETSKALALKIFDEVGLIPGRPRIQRRINNQRGVDPMVIGRILYARGGWNGPKAVSFLITWWLKPSDILV